MSSFVTKFDNLRLYLLGKQIINLFIEDVYMKKKLLGLSEALNNNALLIEQLLLNYKQLLAVDKKLSLHKLYEQGSIKKVDQHFFSSFGAQVGDFRYLEYFLYDREQQMYLYFGSWKWSTERYTNVPCDHIGIFTSDPKSVTFEQILFTGFDKLGNNRASYDSSSGDTTGTIRVSMPPWHNRHRMGLWIDTNTIVSGTIFAKVQVIGESQDKVHMQYDVNPGICSENRFGGYIENQGVGFSVMWDGQAGSSIYSDGVGWRK